MGMEGQGIRGKQKGELGNRGAWGRGVQKDMGIIGHMGNGNISCWKGNPCKLHIVDILY